jgi:hypothetical protein
VRLVRPRLTYANVVSTLCLFLLLGGGAYAAAHLPKNSVGTKQLKKGAVTKVKIANKTLKTLHGAKGPVGPVGPAGPAAQAGGVLPAGVTLRGVASTGITGGSAEYRNSRTGVSFAGFKLSERPAAHVVAPGGPVPPECPGSAPAPEALPGNLCVYVSSIGPTNGTEVFIMDPSTAEFEGVRYDFEKQIEAPLDEGRVSSLGFMIELFANQTVATVMRATWAVTG